MNDETTSESGGEMPRHPNHVHTERKQVWLTPEARGLIQQWADREGLTFSAAVETLARLGLGQDPRDAWSRALTTKVVEVVRRDLHRISGLFAAVAIDAGVAMRLAGAAVKQLRPADYHRIKQIARQEAVALLRRRDALAELGLLDGQADLHAGDDTGAAAPAPAAVGAGHNGHLNGHGGPAA